MDTEKELINIETETQESVKMTEETETQNSEQMVEETETQDSVQMQDPGPDAAVMKKGYLLRFVCGILFMAFGVLVLCLDRANNVLLGTVEFCFGLFEFVLGFWDRKRAMSEVGR